MGGSGLEVDPTATRVNQTVDSYEVIESLLDERAVQLETETKSDIFALHGAITWSVDDRLRSTIETRFGKARRPNRATIVLTTVGGYIEVVRRMVDTLRRHYEEVEFIVPNFAYSAGTVFVMSGDAIHMDYYSRLGPIDPQVPSQDGAAMVPALGYVERYNELINKADAGQLNVAELHVLIGGFDQAQLYQYEQERELSISLLQEWLCNYKFKNWIVTDTRQQQVTDDMRQQRAKEIASALNNTSRWHSHVHGISKDVLECELKLQIDDFGERPELSNKIHNYQGLLTDYMARRGLPGVIHRIGDFSPYA